MFINNRKGFLLGLLTGALAAGVIAAFVTVVGSRLRWGERIAPDDKVSAIYDMLDTYSINEFDRDKIMEDMYRGMLNGVGDPYTYYFDKKAYEAFTIDTEGTYVGIGIGLAVNPENGLATVVTVYPETPAEEAGMRIGDVITRVGEADVTGKQQEEITALIKGREGTAVTLTVTRSGEAEPAVMEVARRNINIPTVSHKMLEGVIGYIRIYQFDRVTTKQFQDALADLTEQQMRGLIIDLRDNRGGLMSTVTDIADTLLPEGVVTYTEDKNGVRKNYESDDGGELNMPMALLVNGNSASASEVLCGAVKDMNKGVLVGERTFGKGIVQNLYQLEDGTAVKITVAKYFTPSGVCIHGEGIQPDYEVKTEGGVWFDLLEEKDDTQLQKAIEVMWSEMAE